MESNGWLVLLSTITDKPVYCPTTTSTAVQGLLLQRKPADKTHVTYAWRCRNQIRKLGSHMHAAWIERVFVGFKVVAVFYQPYQRWRKRSKMFPIFSKSEGMYRIPCLVRTSLLPACRRRRCRALNNLFGATPPISSRLFWVGLLLMKGHGMMWCELWADTNACWEKKKTKKVRARRKQRRKRKELSAGLSAISLTDCFEKRANILCWFRAPLCSL